ncbi:MAG: hypothetical protein Q9214_003711, partial [Letrouitia sp. 1 TL-2023]
TKQYKTKIGEWGYFKNTRRADAVAILREKALRKGSEKQSLFFVGQRPVKIWNVERHVQRYKVQISRERSLVNTRKTTMKQLVCRTPPPAERPLQTPEPWMITEKFLYGLDGLIRGSFESGAWKFFDNERLIESSPDTVREQRRIMTFLQSIDQGRAAAQIGDNLLAGDRWRLAFLEIEYLMKGNYHDIIPNVISKLNDLNNWGFQGVTTMLVKHIASLCHEYQRSGHQIAPIFVGFDRIDLRSLDGLEERIWTMFHSIFSTYVGSQCYNTFVMKMDGAKRRLRRGERENIDECLPSLAPLEKEFGPMNCRPLDVLRLRLETLSERGQYQQVTEEAPLLIQRADGKWNDPWQRCYFLIKAFYCAGSAHFYLGNLESARHHLNQALYLDAEFCKFDSSDQFNTERLHMHEKLGIL